MLGVKYVVGVGNGTDALYLSLKAMGIGPGDEVITAPNSFVATAAAIALTGARPVFVDVRDDYNIDPAICWESDHKNKSNHSRPSHGTTRGHGPIMAIAKRHNLAVVEDVAQAFWPVTTGNIWARSGQRGPTASTR